MTLKELIEFDGYNLISFSKKYEIPYSTLNDIVNDKTKLYTCKGITLYKLAKALNIPMEDLMEKSEYTKQIAIKYEEVTVKCTVYSFRQQYIRLTYKKETKSIDLEYNLTRKAEREYFNSFLEMLADSFMKETISKQNMQTILCNVK